jgi:hypothetical protein
VAGPGSNPQRIVTGKQADWVGIQQRGRTRTSSWIRCQLLGMTVKNSYH